MPHAPNTSSQVEARSSLVLDDGRNPLVLVVDPDASARSVLQVVLVRDGFDVWCTPSGNEGLELVKKRTPDVIVLESDLGGQDGFSFVSAVRGDLKTATVPVLLLAKADDENVANLAEVVGVDDVVQKPAFARDIAALVRLELAQTKPSGEIVFQSGQVAPAHLLRALLSCPRSGRMVLADGRAHVDFHRGHIVDARFGKAWGIDALVRALVLTSGEWSLVLGPVAQGTAFHCSLHELVQVVLPRAHAWEHVLLRSVPLESHLAVDFFRLSKALATMPEDVNRVVQLFDGQRSVRQVLLDSPFDESMTLEVATRLYLMGVVVNVKAASPAATQRAAAPRLFEPAFEAPADEADNWFETIVKGDGKTPSSNDLDGGWKAAALGESPELAVLAPDVARQIEAFNIRIEIEPREMRVPQRAVTSFFLNKTKETKEVAPVEAKPVPTVTPAPVAPVPMLAAEPITPTIKRFDRQERIVTPTLTPAIAAPVPEAVLTLRNEDARLEASFFGPAVTAAAPEALREVKKAPMWLFLGVAAAVLLVAVAFEVAMKPKVQLIEPEVVVAAQPVVVAPVLPDIEEPVFIEDEVPATVIDVSGPLREAKTKYEQGYYPEAISMLEQIIADEPGSVQAWLLLGLARYDSNNSSGAREAAEKVLSLEPNNAGVQMLIATLKFSAGDKVAAREALEKYLALAPTGSSAEEARALLAR